MAQGQSLQVWHDYFSEARIWGLDIHPAVIRGATRLFAASTQRVQVFKANSKSPDEVPAASVRPTINPARPRH